MKKFIAILLVLGVLGSLAAQEVNAPKAVSPFSPFIAERAGLDSIQINPAGVRNGRRETVSAMAAGALHTNMEEMRLLTEDHDTTTGNLTGLYTTFEARGQVGMSLNWLAFAVSQDMVMPVAFIEDYWEDFGETYYTYFPTIDQEAGRTSEPAATAAMNIRLGGLVGGLSGKTTLFVDEFGQFQGIGKIAIDAGANMQLSKRVFVGATADNLFSYDVTAEGGGLYKELPTLNAGAALSLFDIGILEPFAAVDVYNLEQFVFADSYTDTTPTVRAMVGLEVFWMAEMRAQIITQPLLKGTENESVDILSAGFGLNLGIIEVDAGITVTEDVIDAFKYYDSNPPITIDFLAKFNLGRKVN